MVSEKEVSVDLLRDQLIMSRQLSFESSDDLSKISIQQEYMMQSDYGQHIHFIS